MLTPPCSVHVTVFNCAIHYILSMNFTTCRIVRLHFENSTFGLMMTWSDLVCILPAIGGSGRVGDLSGQGKWTRDISEIVCSVCGVCVMSFWKDVINPFNASCSKLLLSTGFSAILS